MPKKPTITSKREAYQVLGNMQVFYGMLDCKDLIGMFDILSSDDPCISFFLDSDHQEVLMTQGAPKNVLNVRYKLNEEVFEEELTFYTIGVFMNTIKENIENEVLEERAN